MAFASSYRSLMLLLLSGIIAVNAAAPPSSITPSSVSQILSCRYVSSDSATPTPRSCFPVPYSSQPPSSQPIVSTPTIVSSQTPSSVVQLSSCISISTDSATPTPSYCFALPRSSHPITTSSTPTPSPAAVVPFKPAPPGVRLYNGGIFPLTASQMNNHCSTYGGRLSPTDFLVTLPAPLYGSAPFSPYCGKNVTIFGSGGGSTNGTVVGICTQCGDDSFLGVSVPVWNAIRMVPNTNLAQWWFN